MSANIKINLANAYKLRPNINEFLTPHLSIIIPLIVNPKANKQTAEIQNRFLLPFATYDTHTNNITEMSSHPPKI